MAVDGDNDRENEDAPSARATSPVSHEPPPIRPEVILTPDQRIRVSISSTLQELAEERVAAGRAIQRLRLAPVWRELRARGADMDWDQVIAYTLTQTTQTLNELESAAQQP